MKKLNNKEKAQINQMYRARTTVENEEQAHFIAKALVESHAAVSVHINEITSTFYWEGAVDTMTEYELDILCIETNKVKKIIDNYHTYKLPEFIYWPIESSKEINTWCNDWCNRVTTKRKEIE